VAQEFIAGETRHGLAARQVVSRNLIRVWVTKLEADTFDIDAEAADLLQEDEEKIKKENILIQFL
jgi:hypothetical protein